MTTFDVNSMWTSAPVVVAVGIFGAIVLVVLLEDCVAVSPPRAERFGHYLLHFEERHAQWCGHAPEESACSRWLRVLTNEHSLVRLVFPAQWRPLPLMGRPSAVQALLTLLLMRLAIVAFFFSPLALSTSRALSYGLAVSFASLSQLALRSAIDAAFAWRARTLQRLTPASYPQRGLSEGHLLARAALTHFDATDTLRRILHVWQQGARYFADVHGVRERCLIVGALRRWRERADGILAVESASRLREQKAVSWSLVRPEWLDQACRRIGRRIAPLGQQFEQVMRLDGRLVGQMSRIVNDKMQPTPPERLLRLPPVERVMRLLGTRWAMREWLGALALAKSELEAMRVRRSSEAAHRIAAGGRRARRLLGVHAGFWMWREAVVEMVARAEVEARLQAEMAALGLPALGSGEADDDESSSEEGGGCGCGALSRRSDASAGEDAELGEGGDGGVGGFDGEGEGGALVTGSRAGSTQRSGLAEAAVEWDGVSALDPEALFESSQWMSALRSRIQSDHPDPAPLSAHMRPLTAPVTDPIGTQLRTLDVVSSIQFRRLPPDTAAKSGKAPLPVTLPKGAITPRLHEIRNRRELLVSMLSKLSSSDATQRERRAGCGMVAGGRREGAAGARQGSGWGVCGIRRAWSVPFLARGVPLVWHARASLFSTRALPYLAGCGNRSGASWMS